MTPITIGAYRARPWLRHLPGVLGPFGTGVLLTLHVGPVKCLLDIGEGVAADGRSLDVFPVK